MTDFEQRYRTEGDPWGYATSPYEREKYQRTLAACGPGPFARALELGGSIGVFSAMLAPRCGELQTVDAAPTAVEAARERLASFPGAHAEVGAIPGDLPGGPFELVVASEVLYYLDAGELTRTLAALEQSTAPGARVVAVHYIPRGPERPLGASAVHAALRAQGWLRTQRTEGSANYLLDVLVRT